MCFVLEVDLGGRKLTRAFDKTSLVGIDQNIGNGWVLEQRLDRTKPGHFVDNVFGKDLQLLKIKRNPFRSDIVRHVRLDLLDEFRFWKLVEKGKVELINDL